MDAAHVYTQLAIARHMIARPQQQTADAPESADRPEIVSIVEPWHRPRLAEEPFVEGGDVFEIGVR